MNEKICAHNLSTFSVQNLSLERLHIGKHYHHSSKNKIRAKTIYRFNQNKPSGAYVCTEQIFDSRLLNAHVEQNIFGKTPT